LGSGIGLLAATSARLYSSAFYALKDTRTPLYFATVRVAVGAALALYAVRVLPGQIGVPVELGAIGITLASGLASWVEYHLLRNSLGRRIGPVRLATRTLLTLWGAALAAAVAAILVKWELLRAYGVEPRVLEQWGGEWLPAPHVSPLVTAALALSVYGAAYFAVTYALGISEARNLLRRLVRRAPA
jgi:putative peptidoglycan lipid II flippase